MPEDEPIFTDDQPPEEPEGDDAPEAPEPKEKKTEEKPEARRSEIAQKIKWRERAMKAEGKASKVESLEAELAELKGLVKKPADDQEAKAQEYIRAQARQVFEDLQSAKDKEESSRITAFENDVEAILEDNPDIPES